MATPTPVERLIPARRFYWLLLLGTAIGLGSGTVGTDLFGPGFLNPVTLATLGFDVLLLVLLVIDGQQLRQNRVTLARQIPQRLSIGRENTIELVLKTGYSAALVQLRDGYPQAFWSTSPTLSQVLPAHSQVTLSYNVFPFKRGKYTWTDLQIRQLGSWRLTWYDWTIPQTQEVTVFPDLIGLRSLSIRLALQASGNLRRAKRLGMGTEFAELREYATGDDPRLIDWKATARRDRPLVRVLEPEQEQTLILLLDRGRLMTAQVNGLTRFDWGLNALLALALTGLNRGDRVGVGVFDRQMQTWIPPGRGQSHLTHLIERLTPLQPEILEPDYLNAVTTVATQQARRALVVLFTDLVDVTASTELLLAMGRLPPRHLPFCVTLRDPEIDRTAQTITTDVARGYTRAVALDLLNQRQLALAKLKQKGVLILDAPVDQISEQLVDRYLQLKLRNQL